MNEKIKSFFGFVVVIFIFFLIANQCGLPTLLNFLGFELTTFDEEYNLTDEEYNSFKSSFISGCDLSTGRLTSEEKKEMMIINYPGFSKSEIDEHCLCAWNKLEEFGYDRKALSEYVLEMNEIMDAEEIEKIESGSYAELGIAMDELAKRSEFTNNFIVESSLAHSECFSEKISKDLELLEQQMKK